MAKLVEILAREYTVWPSRCFAIEQDRAGRIWEADFEFSRVARLELADDWHDAVVTRAQWEAERARIAANQQATAEAREIAQTGAMTTEEQELTAIACGKRSREDQDLWDKVAIAAIGGLTASDIFYNSSMFQYRPDNAAEFASGIADAFMAERAKRLKGGV